MRRLLPFVLALALTACASLRDGVVVSLNAASDFSTVAEPKLEQLDHDEQVACLPRADKAACLASTRARYHAAWDAYRRFRASWIAAKATVLSYDALVAAGKAPNIGTVLAAAKSLADAEQAFAAAAAAIAGAS